MNIKNLIVQGLTTIADSYVSPRDYARPSKDGFRRDQAKLRSDVRRIGADMKTTIDRHGKQSYKPSGG